MKQLKKYLKYVLILGFIIFLIVIYSNMPPNMGIVILLLTFLWLFYSLDKRISKIETDIRNKEEEKGNRFSWSFNIDVQLPVMTNPVFGKVSGIRSTEDGKDWKLWTDKEQQHWEKVWKDQIIKKSHFSLTYLAKEDAFFSRNSEGFTRFVFSDGWYEHDVYGETLIQMKGKGFFNDTLDIYARDRYIGEVGKKTRVITIYLIEYVNGKRNYKILCDFPFTRLEFAEQLGFEVREHPGDVYKDEDYPFGLGEFTHSPDWYEWVKNGVVISHVVFH